MSATVMSVWNLKALIGIDRAALVGQHFGVFGHVGHAATQKSFSLAAWIAFPLSSMPKDCTSSVAFGSLLNWSAAGFAAATLDAARERNRHGLAGLAPLGHTERGCILRPGRFSLS